MNTDKLKNRLPISFNRRLLEFGWAILLLSSLTACGGFEAGQAGLEGPQGPRGPQGSAGQQGSMGRDGAVPWIVKTINIGKGDFSRFADNFYYFDFWIPEIDQNVIDNGAVLVYRKGKLAAQMPITEGFGAGQRMILPEHFLTKLRLSYIALNSTAKPFFADESIMTFKVVIIPGPP